MKIVKILIVITAVLLLQTMVLNKYRWLSLMDVFLLLNIYIALNSDQLTSIFVALASGLVQDTFSEGIIGMNAFSKVLVAFFISSLSSRLMIKHPLIVMLLIVIATNIDFFVIDGLHRIFRLPGFTVSHTILAIASLLNGFAGISAFYIADRIRIKKEYA